ncbi:MAG TPA: patatin-like phospholipase family protein [Mucilaginibacter sp.]|nr:patatin-like phospholipase family protein [Mucilaginibacter sp.]
MAKQPEKITNDTFYVGLCMAGAVSAGAYTAGVMDYLLEALSEWEKRRGEPGVPTHRVQIPVMGGASAGGMTSVMAATALNNPLTPVREPGADLLAEHPENKLYHSWVDLTGPDMFPKMLGTSDIKPGEVVSGLNSDFINPIAERVVSADPLNWKPLPPFIRPGLRVFTTLSNLQGFDYWFDFRNNAPEKAEYHMNIHNDYACFELTENEIPGDNNGWIPLNLKEKINTDIAADAAMATGAFPVGLAPRKVKRPLNYIKANLWLKDYLKGKQKISETSLNVDGGMINNEPFDKVRDVLNHLTGQEVDDYNNYDKFTNTVLMIEPFPTRKAGEISMDRDLLNVVGLTLSAMTSQMRTKPLNLKNAMDDNCAGQYLITPSRKECAKDIKGDRAMACGALDGFSGFINKEFRVHDYFLGRHNCKWFLRNWFTIAAENIDKNPIFRNGYANADRERFKAADGSYQIIPVFLDEKDYQFPDLKFSSGSDWPMLKDSDIERFRGALKKRIQAVVLNIAKFGWLTRFLLWAGAKLVLNRLLAGKILDKIKSDLRTWKLLPPA